MSDRRCVLRPRGLPRVDERLEQHRRTFRAHYPPPPSNKSTKRSRGFCFFITAAKMSNPLVVVWSRFVNKKRYSPIVFKSNFLFVPPWFVFIISIRDDGSQMDGPYKTHYRRSEEFFFFFFLLNRFVWCRLIDIFLRNCLPVWLNCFRYVGGRRRKKNFNSI